MMTLIIERQHNKYFPTPSAFADIVAEGKDDQLMFMLDDEADLENVADDIDADSSAVESVYVAWEDERILFKGKVCDEIIVVGLNEYLPVGRDFHITGDFLTLSDLISNIRVEVTSTKTLGWC